jgi:hypothetical protein
VGHSLSVFYKLPGPLPAGGYALQVNGFSNAKDSHIRADLVLVSGGADGGTETQIATADGPPPPPNDGFHAQTWIKTTLCGAAVGQAGDGLVLRITYVSGSDSFGEIDIGLTIP